MFVFMKYNERFHFRILIPYLVPAVMAQEECFSQGPKSFMERIEKKSWMYQISSLLSTLSSEPIYLQITFAST